MSSDKQTVQYRSVDPPREIHVKMLQANIDTLEKMLKYVAKIYSNQRCLGTRSILSEEDEMQPNGRVFKKYRMGEYKWKSFCEIERAAHFFGCGLRKLGQQPKQNIVLFAETRAEWMIAAHGCFKQNMPIVTVYATLGDEGVAHCINETEVTTIVTSHELLPKFKTLLSQIPKVTKIIVMEDQLKPTETTGFKEGVEVYKFQEVIQMGEQNVCGEFIIFLFNLITGRLFLFYFVNSLLIY